jgi:hypothetical protein
MLPGEEPRPRDFGRTPTTPIDDILLPAQDWTDEISDAMMRPLRQVGLLLAKEIEANAARLADMDVYVRAMERRLEKLEERVL